MTTTKLIFGWSILLRLIGFQPESRLIIRAPGVWEIMKTVTWLVYAIWRSCWANCWWIGTKLTPPIQLKYIDIGYSTWLLKNFHSVRCPFKTMGPIWASLSNDNVRAVIPKERSKFNWLWVQEIMTAIRVSYLVSLSDTKWFTFQCNLSDENCGLRQLIISKCASLIILSVNLLNFFPSFMCGFGQRTCHFSGFLKFFIHSCWSQAIPFELCQ